MIDTIGEIRALIAMQTQTLSKLANTSEVLASNRGFIESVYRSLALLEDRVKALEEEQKDRSFK